ncbi:hypothetical protein [Pseudooceanicola algae]|uniref:Citrate transporter n=1 Tax=Pseudooceanicola algae TaxID=1537215 RepID=A0A418SG56_9RHOB|nr:hypothetical protein [Pseudooceanicola algae]QPM91609.1 hypothetical protein PSAL_028640 [Pseudooceanicola algae]
MTNITAGEAPEGARVPGPGSLRMDRVIGLILAAVVLSVVLRSFTGWDWSDAVAKGGTVLAVALLSLRARWGRRVFVLIGLALAVYVVALAEDAGAVIGTALSQASFITAFFCALATLRHTAEISAPITRAAIYLAQQPPGRRYSALVLGAQVFALVLNYGSISLLGGMAQTSAVKESDPLIREIRTRRMLLAVHRGFAASLVWSPLSFAMVISTSVIAGASWAAVLPVAMASAAIQTGIGWALDRFFKPKVDPSRVPAYQRRDSPAALLPVLWMMLLVAVPVYAIHLVSGVSAALSVLAVVPVVAALWLVAEAPRRTGGRQLRQHGGAFLFQELPGFGGEIILLAMAGFLGSAAGAMLAPALSASGIDLGSLPVWILLLVPIWIIPLGGQFGMNPILFVSLFGPLLPDPATLGIAPAAMVIALTAGWSIAAVTSPFTASVMLIARLGGVTPSAVCFRWNGVFALAVGLALSLLVLAIA